MEVTFTEVQKYFDKFLKIVEIEEVVITIEVISPSTRNKDMKKKFGLFKMTGISEYWMVDVE